MPELDGVLTLSQRMLGVMKPRPLTTLHVGGAITADQGLVVSSGAVTLPPVTWAALPLTGPWSAWDASESAWNVPSYCKDSSGFVHLRGLMGSNGAAVGAVAVTLPVGFRPLKYHYFATPCGTGAIGLWYVQPNGQITLQGMVPTGAAPSTYYALAGITFQAEQ